MSTKSVAITIIALITLPIFGIIFPFSCSSLQVSNHEISPTNFRSDKTSCVAKEINNALGCRNFSRVKEILSNTQNLGELKGFYNTVLLKTVQIGDEPDIVKILLTKGANIGARDIHGNTPLHLSIVSGSFDTVKLLVSEGCDINTKNDEGITPLYYATSSLHKNKKDLVELLIRNNANVNEKNISGNTPLHNIASTGNRDLAILLISKGADVNAKNIGQTTPLHVSALNCNLETAEILVINKAFINVKDASGHTPLMLAIKNGDPFSPLKGKMLVDFLVKKGAYLRDIHSSAAAGNVKKTIAFSLKSSESINSSDNNGNTPLHLAAEFDRMAVANFLVSKGARINTKNNYGNTPLHNAAMYNNVALANFLVSKGARINIENNNSYSPFHESIEKCHVNIVKLFISKGVDVNLQNSLGIAPLCIASKQWDESIVKLLISHGANVNPKVKSQWTPLHYSSERGRIKSVALLLQANADVNAKDSDGRTPLHYAADGGRRSWSKLSVDYIGTLRKERESKPQDYLKTIELLLSAGADVNARDNNGNTPLDFSANHDISSLLRKHGASPTNDIKTSQ